MSGKISRRPSSIAKDKIIFEKPEYAAKFDAGPQAPNAGPTLLKQVAAVVKWVSNAE